MFGGVFLVSPRKAMQNHYEIMPKSHFYIRNVRFLMKSRDLNMSGPAKASSGGQVFVRGFCLFYQKLHLSFVS